MFKENGSWSLGRVFAGITFIVLQLTIIANIVFSSIPDSKVYVPIPNELIYILMLFMGYTTGTKAVNLIKDVKVGDKWFIL